MPAYRYTCDKGHEQVDAVESFTNRKKFMKCKTCGNRSYWAFGANTQASAGWPRSSDAMSVHPDQIKEAGDYDYNNGVTTQYKSDGSPIYRDKQHQDKHLRLHGYFDRDAGYSGVTPTYQGDER